jgi:hypothetical protein
MMKWLAGGFAVLVALAMVSAGWLWFGTSGTFSRLNYERIQPGMSLAQIEQLLGEPGESLEEQYVTHVVDRSDEQRREKPVIHGEKYYRWRKKALCIIVSFENEVVAEKYFNENCW